MKKQPIVVVLLLLLTLAIVFTACTDAPTDVTVDVSVNKFNSLYHKGKFYIDDQQADSFDYSKLFVVTEGDDSVTVTKDMLDVSGLTETGGTVTCTYKGKSATAEVAFEHIFYQLEQSVYKLTLSPSEAANYDFKSHFRALANGESVEITDDMVTSDVKSVAGDYTYTVTFRGISKSIAVRVEDIYVITANRTSLTMESKDFVGYDFVSLFSATKNGKDFELTSANLDFGKFPRWGGTGKVICRANNYSAEIPVTVTPNEYIPSVRRTTFTVNAARVDGYDFASLFTLSVDGAETKVTAAMLDGTVAAIAGEYTLTLTTDNKSVSVAVTVVEHEVVQAVVCYPQIRLAVAQASSYDCTRLFMLYVDEQAVPVTDDMIDADALKNATEPGRYAVELSYTMQSGSVCTATAYVTLSDEQTLVVTAIKPTVEVYPNATPIDLTSLFRIVDNGVDVPVTGAMLGGNVDYTKAGNYTVTCSYGGITATVVVTVKGGVVIVPSAERIDVRAGTDMRFYDFSADFKVVVNGITLSNVGRYITVGGKKLTELADPTFVSGEYEVKVTVPYNEKTVPVTGIVSFKYYTATINYVVVRNIYRIDVLDETVVPSNPGKFDPLSNVRVYLNGQTRAMTLTDNVDYVDQLTLYAVVRSGYNPSLSLQQIIIDVYVNGPQNEPVTVNYTVEIRESLEVTATDAMIFTGETLYTTDLFTVVEGGRSVTVTNDMVSGKVDLFTPGLYIVSVSYGGVTKTARVTVLDGKMAGKYKTRVMTIPNDADTDEDGDTVSAATSARRYSDLVIGTDCTLAIGTITGRIVGGNDDGSLSVAIGGYNYTMYFADGIAVLVPLNELHMSYSETGINRVLTYVSEDMYEIEAFVVVNNQRLHVIKYKYDGYYTIEAMLVRSKADGTTKWFAARTGIKEVSGVDIYYTESHGEIVFSEGFVPESGATATYTFLGETNRFTVGSDGYSATIVKDDANKNPFADHNYTAADGSNARLFFEGSQKATYTEGGKVIFRLFSTEFAAMKHGGVLDDHTFFAYAAKFGSTESQYYSYKFDIRGDKFTLLPRDNLMGYYVLGDMYVFLDGYGTGFAHFSGNSYEITSLRYNLVGSEIHVEFVNAKANFGYGDTADFYLSPLLNVLTVKNLGDNALAGQQFVNTQITDGAVVTVGSYSVPKATKSGAPDEFYNAIEVTTKDGAWTLEDKKRKENIDVSTVGFTKPGVYRYTINVEVGGKKVSANYMVEVLEPLYDGNEFVGEYTRSPMAGGYALVLDEYGRATLTVASIPYEGRYDVYGQKVVVTARNDAYGVLKAEAEMLFGGTLNVTAPGFGSFVVTKGNLGQSGNGSITLLRISYGGQTAYYLSVNATLHSVSPVFGTNSTVTLTTDGKQRLFKVESWNDGANGLTEADGLQGSYNRYDDQSADVLTLDGFCSFTLGTRSGTYRICDNGSLFVTFTDGTYSALMVKDNLYRMVATPTGEQLVAGKTFRGSVKFKCGAVQYIAETCFEFGEGGTVVCKSVSPMHDSDEDYMCGEDTYTCAIGNAEGKSGTYTVDNLTVTVQIGGQTIVFTLNDPLTPGKLTCASSTMDRNMHGGICAGDEFNVQK